MKGDNLGAQLPFEKDSWINRGKPKYKAVETHFMRILVIEGLAPNMENTGFGTFVNITFQLHSHAGCGTIRIQLE